MPTKKDQNLETPSEQELFTMLVESSSAESLATDLKNKGIKEDVITSLLDNHFYLAPINILHSQWLLGFAIIAIMLALTIVRTGADIPILFITTLLSICLASPFFVIAVLIKRNFSLNSERLLTIASMIYFIVIGLAFIVYCIFVGLFGLIFIPLTIGIFYFLEIAKLRKLLIYLEGTAQL